MSKTRYVDFCRAQYKRCAQLIDEIWGLVPKEQQKPFLVAVHNLHGNIAPLNNMIPDHIATLESELAQLRAEGEGMREDAERWRTLPAFLEKHQINYVMLLADIDAARKEADRG